ncbi:MAG: hypothetical protein IJF07_01550 [Lachnospiraceae bacterium]|nr:hypothetical protein [Lachnospiraceae bacterium]
MLWDLFLKLAITPENILGLLWNIVTIVGMCLIFCAWKEKWWKSLIPFYGTYIIYKHTWKNLKWLFVLQLVIDFVGAKATSIAKKHITSNVFESIKTYVETEEIAIDISVEQLFACLVVALISSLIVWILTRITYMKVCSSLQIQNVLLKIGSFLLPEIFLLVDYIYFYNREKKKDVLRSTEVAGYHTNFAENAPLEKEPYITQAQRQDMGQSVMPYVEQKTKGETYATQAYHTGYDYVGSNHEESNQ